jgi:hypothetical protein
MTSATLAARPLRLQALLQALLLVLLQLLPQLVVMAV